MIKQAAKMVKETGTENSAMLKRREFDDVLHDVGDFSKFQYIQWTLFILISMPQIWYTYAPVFAVRKVKENQLSCENNANITGKGFCRFWQDNMTYCGDVLYDTDFTSIATDWDIICDDAKKYIPLTKTIFYAGKLVGAYLFGWISDRYGRRVTLLSTMSIQFVASLIQTFSVNFTMYVILRVPLGICSGGLFIAAFTLMNEMVRPNRRTRGATIIMVFLGTSLTLLSFIAYFVRNWKYFNIIVTLPNVLVLVCYWLVPESPRWLAARRRFREAENILHKMAVTNRKEYKKGSLEQIELKEKKKTYHLWHLFSTRYLTKISIIEGWSWMVTSGVFYGLAFNSGNLSGNFYLNYAATGMAEIPAPLFAGYFIERFGRRKPLIAYYLLAGIFLLSISPIQALGKQDELSAVVMALALIGKTCISAAYYQIYIYTAELYPTVIRVAGIGFASLCARIGGMAAPYIVDSTSLIIPCLVFGTASITAGIATCFLPETLGKHLPDHIEHSDNKTDKNLNAFEMD